MLRSSKAIATFLTLILTFAFVQKQVSAQALSTEGKDFWVGYLTNWLQNGNNPVILELYISANDSTSGTVSIPRQSSFSPINFEVYPGETRRITIPTSRAMASGSNNIEEKGVHVETDNNVSVYAMNKRQYSADITVILPTFSLGNDYFVLSHWEDGNRNNNANSDSEFLVVAITDSTEVEITPTHQTINGNPASVPFRVTLQKGQTYQIRAKGDMTGTQIVATNQSNCQNFAVFSGNMYTQVGDCNVRNGHDHLYAQMYPTNTLGKEFIVVPLEGRFGGDIIKLLATQDNTTILVNGKTYTANAREHVRLLSVDVLNVSSDKPVAVGQYSRTMNCDGTLGDPFLIPISPSEQFLQKITFNAPSIATISEYSLNIITRQSELTKITFDGSAIGNEFKTVPDSEFAYAQIKTIGGDHTIQSEGGFIAYVYGFGHSESFGYATGASMGNLNIDFSINDQNLQTPSDSLCLNSEISFTPIVDSIYTYFEYNFGDGNVIFSNTDTTVYHSYTKPGEYLVSMTASTGGDDCSNGNEETALKRIQVLTPHGIILGPRSVCPNSSNVLYHIAEVTDNNYQWFTQGSVSSLDSEDCIFIDWGITNSNAQVKLLATNRYGCISDTIGYPVKINIQLDPEAPFGPDTLCANNITEIPYFAYFTEASTYQWQTDFGQISNGNGSNLVTVDWEAYGVGKLWFNQISITDTVCDGVSDTLLVYIQRNPSEYGEIITEKDTIMIGEPAIFKLTADSLYQFANWQIVSEITFDTIEVDQSVQHIFQCEGAYTVIATAYDTGTVCSETIALMQKEIYLKPVSIELVNVTLSEPKENALDINWKTSNSAFYPKKLLLYRRTASAGQWNLIANLDPDLASYTDTDVSVDDQEYEYKIETNVDCNGGVSSDIHKNVVLNVSKEDEEAIISWNEYVGWYDGVESYQVRLSIDSSAYQLIEATSDLQLSYKNEHKGFDFCFQVRTIENGGNKSSSKSNISCVEFIPEIRTYNVITPNTESYADQFNEYFTIDNIEHYENSKLTIFNRYGKVVYDVLGYKNNWNGRINGETTPSGIYYYELQLNEPRNELKTVKGQFSILY